jgi:hypothetical protein
MAGRQGRRRAPGLLDLGINLPLVDPQSAYLRLHESQQARAVVAVELLQRLDLFLESLTSGGQIPHHLLIPQLGSVLQPRRTLLGILSYLGSLRLRVGDHFLTLAPSALRMRLSFLGQLGRLCPGVRENLLGLAPDGVGLHLRVPNYRLGRGSSILLNLVRMALRTRDMLVGGPLRQRQHLQCLLLNFARRLRIRLGGINSGSVGRAEFPPLRRRGVRVWLSGATLDPAVIQKRTS